VKKPPKASENGSHLMTGGGNVDLCVGCSVLSQTGCAQECSRKSVPRNSGIVQSTYIFL